MMLTQRLRHRVRIEQRVNVSDPLGGVVTTWSTFADDVPAEVVPLSARELLSANQIHGEVVARITVRWMAGLDPTMRIIHGADIYNIAGVLPDNRSGRMHITLPVTAGVNAG